MNAGPPKSGGVVLCPAVPCCALLCFNARSHPSLPCPSCSASARAAACTAYAPAGHAARYRSGQSGTHVNDVRLGGCGGVEVSGAPVGGAACTGTGRNAGQDELGPALLKLQAAGVRRRQSQRYTEAARKLHGGFGGTALTGSQELHFGVGRVDGQRGARAGVGVGPAGGGAAAAGGRRGGAG